MKRRQKNIYGKVKNHMKKELNRWKKETGIGFILCETESKPIIKRLLEIDKE